MQPKFLIPAVVALAAPALVNAEPAPYAMAAAHADFVAQLAQAGAVADETGVAARRAAHLMQRQNAAQERLVLPLLASPHATAGSQAPLVADPKEVEAELADLFEGDVDLVTALAQLFAAADLSGQREVAMLAERAIWHETSDVEVLYPAALLVARTAEPG